MRNIYRSLWLILTAATQKELARYVAYLKAENKILRIRLPARVLVAPTERRQLVRPGAKLDRTFDELVTIVYPGAMLKIAMLKIAMLTVVLATLHLGG